MVRSSFPLLKKAKPEDFFHLQNGLDIESVRELVVALRKLSDDDFSHHVNEHKNDFSRWILDVFGDANLAKKIASITVKDDLIAAIEAELIVREELELKKFGISVSSTELSKLEKYIEKKLAEGFSPVTIREMIDASGLSQRLADLIITGKTHWLKDKKGITSIENLEALHNELESLKGKIIDTIIDGGNLKEVKAFLKKEGWDESMFDLIFYDVFKPHPNIKKLEKYILSELKKKHGSLEQVKKNLAHLGWKEYVIDSVVYGLKEPENQLENIISYVREFTGDDDELKKFLLTMGWEQQNVEHALLERELDLVEKSISTSLNIENGFTLKKNAVSLSKTLIELLKGSEVDDLISSLKKKSKMLSLSDFVESENSLMIDMHSMYCYGLDDIKKIEMRESKTVKKVLFLGSAKPLFVELKNTYVIVPQLVKHRCIVCNKLFKINRLEKVEFWDSKRIHKVQKFVCKDDRSHIQGLLDSNKIMY